MGSFVDPDHFVNTGLTHAFSYDIEDENEVKIPKEKTIFLNEHATLLFSREEERYQGLLYQTYTELDLLMLKGINAAIRERSK